MCSPRVIILKRNISTKLIKNMADWSAVYQVLLYILIEKKSSKSIKLILKQTWLTGQLFTTFYIL